MIFSSLPDWRKVSYSYIRKEEINSFTFYKNISNFIIDVIWINNLKSVNDDGLFNGDVRKEGIFLFKDLEFYGTCSYIYYTFAQ